MPLFDRLLLLDQRAAPQGAAWNMALDEALLTVPVAATLRV